MVADLHVSYILPIIVLILFVQGYWDKIFKALFMR